MDDGGSEDLFGSGSEDFTVVQPAGAEPQAADGGAHGSDAEAGDANWQPAPGSAPEAVGNQTPVADLPDERDLFGDSGEEAEGAGAGGDDPDERELFGSEEGADEGQVDERELFGSEEEGDDGAQMRAASQAGRSPAPSEMSEMDEREIFGDVSDDEPEKVEDVILRRRPAPTDDRLFMSLRLPNVLSIDKNAYSRETLPQSLLEGFKEFKNGENKLKTRLMNPENCIRWRFRKGPDGHNMTDEDGRPQYESNARVVEWEDGSKTLYIGKESFDITEVEDNVMLFEENSQDIHVCHGKYKTRMVVTPRNLNSATHEMLKKSQYHKFEANRRSLLISQEEQDAYQALLEIQADQSKKMRADEMQQKRALERGPEALTAAFLEQDLEGGSEKRARVG